MRAASRRGWVWAIVAAHAAAELEAELRELRRLARAGLPRHDDDLVVADRREQVLAAAADRQLGRIGDGGHGRAALGHARLRALDVGLELAQRLRVGVPARAVEPALEPVRVAQGQLRQARAEVLGGRGHRLRIWSPPCRAAGSSRARSPFAAEVLIRIERFANPETGFAVLDADHDGQLVVLVGPLAHLEVRERVRVEGTWRHDKRYGPQVRVASAEPVGPSGEAALTAYLRARPARGQGARRAAAARATARTCWRRSTATRRPRSARSGSARGAPARRCAPGTSCAPPARCTCCWRRTGSPGSCRGSRSTTPAAGTAWSASGPYDLTAVFGVGFQVADTIARAQGVAPDSPARARAGVVHVLAEAERNGSTCLPVGELAAAAGELLGAAPGAQLLDDMAEHGLLVLEPGAGDVLWAYRPQTAELEAELAERVRELAPRTRAAARAHGGARRPTSCPRRRRPTPCARRWSRGCRS